MIKNIMRGLKWHMKIIRLLHEKKKKKEFILFVFVL